LKKLPHIVDKKLYRLEQKQSVLYTKMFNFLKRIFIFVANCRISVGVSPSAAEAPVIIFFPLLPLAELRFCRIDFLRPARKLSGDNSRSRFGRFMEQD